MRKSVIIVAAFVALASASTALAGGWATVKLSSSPKGLTADDPWVVDITVLQHGLASQPLCCLKPTVTIRKVGLGANDERGQQDVADLQGEADKSLRRLPRAHRLPERGHLAVRGLRCLHRVRRRPHTPVRSGEDLGLEQHLAFAGAGSAHANPAPRTSLKPPPLAAAGVAASTQRYEECSSCAMRRHAGGGTRTRTPPEGHPLLRRARLTRSATPAGRV